MLKCQDITRLASEQMDRELSFRERAGMKAHLLMCSGCWNFSQQMKYIRRFAQVYGQSADQDSDNADSQSGDR